VIERYILRQALWPLVASVATLALLALLTQSVSTLDVIIDQRQSVFTYLQITLLAMPQLIALVLPLALFVATIYAVNRLQGDSELVVCSAAGMSKRQLAAPFVKIAIGALIVNLAINLWVQPYSFRTMRERLYEIRGDLAAQLVRPGQFTSNSDGLTIYAREMERGGRLVDVLIQDASNPEAEITYMARTGVFAEVGGSPQLVLYDGSVQSLDENHALSFGTFESYQFQLDAFIEADGDLFYKLSDRFLDELFFPEPEDDWAIRFRDRLFAEGHYRLSAPLYAPALALIALAAILGGQYSRTGYARRIAVAAALAMVVRLVGFAVQSACTDNIWLNPLQYAVPLISIYLAGQALLRDEKPARRRRKRRPPPEPEAAGVGVAPAPAPGAA
jgi:lipopolysaccharide export system permease protein